MAHLRRLAVRLLLFGVGGVLLSYVMALIALSLHGSENAWWEALMLIITMGYGAGPDMSALAAVPPTFVFGVSSLAVQAGVLLGVVVLLLGGDRHAGIAESD